MEPLNCGSLYIDVLERWRLPVVLWASTTWERSIVHCCP
ncbi:hypothetical protein [Bradyrhizobium uaiense]|nr:hypothetical protein [Bradyrhizobium uaiense]